MKKFQMLGLFLSILLITGSCQNEKLINPPESLKEQISLNANRGMITRTHLGDDGKQVVWSEGDQIYVSSNDGRVTGVLTLDKDDAGKSTGTFSGYVFGNPDELNYSVYPVPSNGVLDLAQVKGGDKLNAPMIGQINNKSVQFENTCGILRVNLQNATGKDFTISAKSNDNLVNIYTSVKVVFNENTNAELKYSSPMSSDGKIHVKEAKGGFMYIPYYIDQDVDFYVNNIQVASIASDNFIGKVIQKNVKTLVYSEKSEGFLEPTTIEISDNNVTTNGLGEKTVTINVASFNGGNENNNIEVHEFISVPSITESLEASEKVKDVVVELPKLKSTSAKTSVVSFDEIPQNATVKITEEITTDNTKNSVEELTVIIPSSTVEETGKENVVIDMPNTTVTIQSSDGEILQIQEMEATTADETLIIHKHVKIGKLNVKKGKVEVYGHIGEIKYHHKGEGGKKPILIIKPGGCVDKGKEDFDWKDENKSNDQEDVNETNVLLLPTGNNFNSALAPILKSNPSIKIIRFITDSKVTSKDILVTDENKMKAYLVVNDDCLEIHTSADNYVAHWDSGSMFFKHDESEVYPISYFKNITTIEFGNNFDTSGVRNMSEMFAWCTSLHTLDIGKFDTSNAISMRSMFIDCEKLRTINLSNFNTSNVWNMSQMFRGCSSLKSLDVSSFNTSKLMDMSFMFCECASLESLNLSSFDTSMVTDIRSMFGGCASLQTLNISSFDTSNIVDMYGVFSGCRNLSSLDVSHFDTSKVTDMGLMFHWCTSLTSLDLSTWNTSEVSNMDSMFGYCKKLKDLNLIGRFNTSSVTNMQAMFEDCSSLTSLNLDNFDTSNVIVMNGMFVLCESLVSLDLSSFNTSNVTTMSSMFSKCINLENIYLSNFNLSNVTDLGEMFNECYNLKELDLTNFSFENSPDFQLMLYMTGKESGSINPIPIKVTKEGYDYLTESNNHSNTGIGYNNYAKFVIVASDSDSNINIGIGSWGKGE